MSLKRILFFLLYGIASACTMWVHGQYTQMPFGPNRVQNENWDWKFVSTANFDIFFYDKGYEAAYYAAKCAELDFARIKEWVGYSSYNRIRIIVYNTPGEMLQSNIRYEPADPTVGGQTNFVKFKVEIAFNGDHNKFRKDLNEGIAKVLITDFMYGGSIKELLQNSLFMRLPDWYIEGLGAYLGHGYDEACDEFMRDATINRKLKHPRNYEGEEARVAGQSFWHFVLSQHGMHNIYSILSFTRSSRNDEEGFQIILGYNFSNLLQQWNSFYKEEHLQALSSFEYVQGLPALTLKSKEKLTDQSLSPDGKNLLWVENYLGNWQVKTAPVSNTQKSKILISGGNRSIYQAIVTEVPRVGWWLGRPAVLYVNNKNKYLIQSFNAQGQVAQTKDLSYFDQVLSFEFSADGQTLLLSAVVDGMTDIYRLAPGARKPQRLTFDIYDDLDPAFVPGTDDFVFVSNRTDDTLTEVKNGYHTIYPYTSLYLYSPERPNNVKKIATYTTGNITQPCVTAEGKVLFLSSASGIANLYATDTAGMQSKALTMYVTGIASWSIAERNNYISVKVRQKEKDKVLIVRDFDINNQVYPGTTRRIESLTPAAQDTIIKKIPLVTEKKDTIKKVVADTVKPQKVKKPVDPFYNELDSIFSQQVRPDTLDSDNLVFETDTQNEYFFNSDEKTDKAGTIPLPVNNIQQVTSNAANSQTKSQEDIVFVSSSYWYKNSLTMNRLTSSIMADPLLGFGLIMGASATDLMGNHRISGNLLGILDFRSSDMNIQYQYLKHRMDFGFKYDKKRIFVNRDNILHKYALNHFEWTASYPISTTARISISPVYMNTKFYYLSSPNTATYDAVQHYAGLKLEWVSDNTRELLLNQPIGVRTRISLEKYGAYKNENAGFGKFYADIRAYAKLVKTVVAGIRLSGGTFFGRSTKNFLLGGVDNWPGGTANVVGDNNPLAFINPISPLFDNNSEWFFNHYATSLRGLNYNYQYGKHYFLVNTELRIPFFNVLSRAGVKSHFFNNFIVAPFLDLGTAWDSGNPFTSQTAFNVSYVNNAPFFAEVKNLRSPILMSYGISLRSYLLGYYVKLDIAIPRVDGESLDTRVLLSLGYDF